jgi:peptidoglycan/LPS O-acetylase OafA/YrhL
VIRRTPAAGRLQEIDILRGITILWIAAFHFYVDTRGAAGDLRLPVFQAAFARGDVAGLVNLAGRTLVALPSYRLDVLLFVTGLVLSFSRQPGLLAFWKQRARAVLPNYWLGSLAAAALLVGFAWLRASVKGTPVEAEISDGTLLARGPYHFEWTDIPLSLSVVGRMTSPEAMQVMAPSMWYVLLVMQLYLIFPVLKWLLARVGPWIFLAACTALMYALRSYVIEGNTLPGYDVPSTLLYCIPLRLVAPALGMVAALYIHRLPMRPSRLTAALLAAPALVVVIWSIWFGTPVAGPGAWGATVPLLVGVPALWMLSGGASHLTRTAAVLTWIGARSLSLLVVQDFLRLATGTGIAFWGRPDAMTWYVMPVYLAAAVALTPLWHRVPESVVSRIFRPPVAPAAVGSSPP